MEGDRPEKADAAEAALVEFAEVADRLFAPVALIAADSTLLYINAAGGHAVGREPAALVGRRMLDLVHPDDRPRVRLELGNVASGRPSGGVTTYRLRVEPTTEWRVFESTVDNLLDDPRVGGILLSSRDVTGQLAHERELHDAAYHDALTGLPNRAMLDRELSALVASAGPVAAVFVGVDRFKLINDSLGHTVGDSVLQAVAARIESCLPKSAFVARFGADVFVVLVAGEAEADVHPLAWRVVERVREPLFVAGHELRLSSSAGIARLDAASTAESMLRDAGLALHRAKASGGGRIEAFEAALRDAAVARLELEADLRQAIAGSALSLALQPIVRLEDRSAVSSEALLRWHRRAASVPPVEFIPVAEETGMIVPLGDWTIDRAARLARKAPGGRVAVNLSPRQLAAPGLPERIARVLAATRLEPRRLGFEITETLLIERFDYAVNVLQSIRELGCPVGLDDFGTGYSSLGYLRRLPIDFLKLDRGLCADVDTDCQARAIVEAVIVMAHTLGLDVVAEGVETEAQAEALMGIGCVKAQGFLLGRPTEV